MHSSRGHRSSGLISKIAWAFFFVTLLVLFFYQGLTNFHPPRLNRCAMTYFKGDMTPLYQPHAFYELTQFNIDNAYLPQGTEFFASSDKTLDLASSLTLLPPPSHPEDEVQHLLFFFPGNGGSRWQGRSLGSKLNALHQKAFDTFTSFPFDGLQHNRTHIDPSVPAMSPQLSYLLGELLTPTETWHGNKAYRRKFEKTTDQNNGSSWFDSSSDVIYRPDELFEELIKLNHDSLTRDDIGTLIQSNSIHTSIFTFSFHEQASAFSGYSLQSQQEFAVASMLNRIQIVRRQYHGKIRISLVGHSMGGVLAMSSVKNLHAALQFEKLSNVEVAAVVTIGSPIVPIYIPDHAHLQIYNEVEQFAEEHENCTNPDPRQRSKDPRICQISVLHVDGGQGDEKVLPAFTAVHKYQTYKHPKTISAVDLAVHRQSSDHDCLAYCAQVIETVAVVLLRRLVLESLAVARINLSKTVPNDTQGKHHLLTPTVEYLEIPEGLNHGVLPPATTTTPPFTAKSRFEFASALTSSMPVADIDTFIPQSNFDLLNFVNNLVIGTDKLPLTTSFESQPDQIIAPLPQLSVSHRDLTTFTQPWLDSATKTKQAFPPLSKSLSLEQLHAVLPSTTSALLGASQFPVSLHLCLSAVDTAAMTHQCVDLTSHFAHPIPTPYLLFSTWRQPHTVRPDPENHDEYLSRPARFNDQNSLLEEDKDYIPPRDLIVTEHASAFLLTLSTLHSIAKDIKSVPRSRFKVSSTSHYQELVTKMGQLAKDGPTSASFLKNFILKTVISPAVLEGIVSYRSVSQLDINWDNIRANPMWFGTINLNHSGTQAALTQFNVLLADPSVKSPSSFIPSAEECDVMAAGMLHKVSPPVLVLQVTATTSGNYFISQSPHFAPGSAWAKSCLVSPPQRFIQGNVANTVVDLVGGTVRPRPRNEPIIPFDPSLPSPSKTSYGLLPVPNSVLNDIMSDGIRLDNKHLSRPHKTSARNQNDNQTQTAFALITLLQDFDTPALPEFIRRFTLHFGAQLVPILVLAIQLIFVTTVWRLYKQGGQKRWLSVLIDQLDEQDTKDEMKRILSGKTLPLPGSSHDHHQSSRECRSGCKGGFHRFKCLILALFKHLFVLAMALLLTVIVTVPILMIADQRLFDLLPQPLMGVYKPILVIWGQIGSILTPLVSQISTLISKIDLISDQIQSHDIYRQAFNALRPLYKFVVDVTGDWVWPFFTWCGWWFTPLTYILSPWASPLYHSLSLPSTSASGIRLSHGLTPSGVLAQFLFLSFCYYTCAFGLSCVLRIILRIAFGVLALPLRIINALVFDTVVRVSVTLRRYTVIVFAQILFPLTLIFGIAFPLAVTLIYSTLGTLVVILRQHSAVKSGLQNSFGLYFIYMAKMVIGDRWFKTASVWITDAYLSLHCYLKQFSYWLIHHIAVFVKDLLDLKAQAPVFQVTKFLQTLDKTHLLSRSALYFHRVATDFATYTYSAVSPVFTCMLHENDMQLLPVPITTATIVFLTFLGSILLILITRVMIGHQFESISTYLDTFHNTTSSRRRLDLYNAKIQGQRDRNETVVDDDLVPESTHTLNRILRADFKASKRSTHYIFWALILATLATLFFILPAVEIMSDVAPLSLKDEKFRDIYLWAQSNPPVVLPGDTKVKRIHDPIVMGQMFRSKLDQAEISIDQFNRYAQETVSFSLFYTPLNLHPKTNLAPSHTHNPYAKSILSGQWYEQQGAWMPTKPVDIVLLFNPTTAIAFSLLVFLQLATILTYFYHIQFTKTRLLDIISPMSANIVLCGPLTEEELNAPMRAPSQSDIEQICRENIEFDPALFTVPVSLISFVSTIAFDTVVLIVLAPYLLPIVAAFFSVAESVADRFALSAPAPLSPTELLAKALPLIENVITPHHVSTLPIQMMAVLVLNMVTWSFNYPLVIPNEVNRPHKPNPVE